MLNVFHFEIDAEVWLTKYLSVRHKYDNVIKGASSSSQIILKQYLRPGMIKKRKETNVGVNRKYMAFTER